MTTPTRIALVTWSLPGGGVEIYLLRLGEYLTRQGFQVDIITTEEPGAWFDRIAPRGIGAVHIDGALVATPILHAMRVGRRLAAGNYQVVFLNGAYTAQLALNILPDDVIAIPVLHGDIDFVYRKYCANAGAWNVVVAVSPKVRREAQQRVPNRTVLFIPNGVDLPAEDDWLKRQPYAHPFRLVYVGRLEQRQKGIFFLPEILEGCLQRGLEVTLTIAGDGPDSESLQQAFAQRGLKDRVEFVGHLTPQQVYATYLDAHVMLMPSFWEGLPTVLLEAQACGCVPIASRLPEITDVAVADGQSGILVEIGDVQGFVDGITNLYTHPEQWAQCSAAAHAKVVNEFSVEVMGKTYQRLIAECLVGLYPLPHGKRGWFPIDLRMVTIKDFIPFWFRRLFPKSWKRAVCQKLNLLDE